MLFWKTYALVRFYQSQIFKRDQIIFESWAIQVSHALTDAVINTKRPGDNYINFNLKEIGDQFAYKFCFCIIFDEKKTKKTDEYELKQKRKTDRQEFNTKMNDITRCPVNDTIVSWAWW